MLSKWRKQDDKPQKVENKMMKLDNVEVKFKIDGLTYWTIDNMIKEKSVDDGRINLETNQFIANLFSKA